MDRIKRREYAQIAMVCDKANPVKNKAACRSTVPHCNTAVVNKSRGPSDNTCSGKSMCSSSMQPNICDSSRKNQGKLFNRFDKPTFVDGNLISVCPQKKPYKEPTHLAQKHSPWNDLHQRYTLSSSRHEVYHYDPQVCFSFGCYCCFTFCNNITIHC